MGNATSDSTTKENKIKGLENVNIKIANKDNKYTVSVKWNFTLNIISDSDCSSNTSSYTKLINTKDSYENIFVCGIKYKEHKKIYTKYISLEDIVNKICKLNENIKYLFQHKENATINIHIDITVKLCNNYSTYLIKN